MLHKEEQEDAENSLVARYELAAGQQPKACIAF